MQAGAVVVAAAFSLAGCSTLLGFQDATQALGSPDAGAAAQVTTDAGSSMHPVFAAALDAQAESGVPAVRFAPVAVDFGNVECRGDAPDPQALTISNTGSADLVWSASLGADAGPFQILGDTRGTVAPGNEIALAIATDPLDSTGTPGTTDVAILTLSTNDPLLSEQLIQIQRRQSGAWLGSDAHVLAFATPDAGVTSSAQTLGFLLENSGDVDVQVMASVAMDPSFGVAWLGAPRAATAEAGGALAFTVSYDPAKSVGTPNAVTFDVDGPLCGDTPVVVILPGEAR